MANRTPVRGPARVYLRQSREHYRFDPPNLLMTTLFVAAAIAVVAVAERSTTFTDYNAPKQPTVFQPPNTLLTLLAPPVAAPVVIVQTPFNQQDWPNPGRPWQRDLNWSNTPEVIPQVQLQAAPSPFAQEDWPNPQRPWIRDLTWTDTPQVIPKVADIAVANRIPNQTDWPNPVRAWQRDLTWTQSPAVPPAPALPADAAPFAQEDWPNPLRSPIRDLTWTQTPQAIPQVPPVIVAQAPFEQPDWPNPIRPWVRDLTWTQSPQVQQIIPAAAVAEGRRTHGFTDYFAKQQPVQFDPPNLLLTLLQPAVVIPPEPASNFPPAFVQTDWPNPVLRTPFRESGWIKFANIGDIPARPTPPPVVPAPPFAQEDWPNPVLRTVRIKVPQSFRPPFDTTVTTAVVSTTFPFSQEDWPNPIRRIAQREFGFTRFANVSDIPQRFIAPAPFDQTDWPNPLTPWRRDLTWLQGPQVQQIVPEAAGSTFPFSLLDQPNPVLRTPFNESGWVRVANIGDIPAAAPPVPVPPIPVDEVKPSGGRVRHEPVHHAGTIDPEFRYAIEGRKTYAQKLQDLRIAQEAAHVIEQVALQQAATLEVDEAKNARELKRALRVAQLEDDARYLELLAERRELAKTEEIGALLYKAARDEEDILALLMIAAQLL